MSGALSNISANFSGGAGLSSIASLLGTPSTLQLDNIILDPAALEVPETIGTLGGLQVLAEHDFPGGVRTHQVFGAFPDQIQWRAYLTGPQALDRAQALDLIRVTGREVQLTWGPKAFLGRVVRFDPTPHHKYLVRYYVLFKPRVDISQASPQSGQVTAEGLLSGQTSALSALQAGVPFALMTALTEPTSSLLSTVAGSLAQASGIVSAIGPSNVALITAGAGALVSAATPYFNATNPQNSYMARAAANRAQAISGVVAAPALATPRTIQVTNPNLPRLAAQYLGSANQWTTIAAANGLNDPLPIGSFILTIPAAPAAAPVLQAAA